MNFKPRALIVDCYGVLVLRQPSSSKLFEYEWKINRQMVDFLQRKRHSGSKIVVLSNAAQYNFEQFFSPEQQIELFDGVVLSGETGILKPDPEAFRLSAKVAGEESEACVMIDDSAVNLDGAREVGLKTIFYGDFNQFKRDYEKLTERSF